MLLHLGLYYIWDFKKCSLFQVFLCLIFVPLNGIFCVRSLGLSNVYQLNSVKKVDFFPVSQHGDKIDEKEKIKCPEGWEWTRNWQVDDNRAVDGEGIVPTEIFYYF